MTNYNRNAFQGTGFASSIDAYDFYKKNVEAAQEVVSSLGFNSVQEASAALGQNLMPSSTPTAPITTATATTTTTKSFFNTSLLTGIAVGAGIAFVATNPTVQKAVIGASVGIWSALQANIEEVKEQIEDAKAELSQEKE